MPNPTLPAPPTWASGPIPAPELRAVVSDAIALLSRPPMFFGQQTTSAQSIPNNAITTVQLDTDQYDSWNGHREATSNANYYGMFPGWYLCESSAPVNTSAAGSSKIGSLLGAVQNGSAFTLFGGMRIGASSTVAYQAACSKLVKLQQTGTFGSGDYVSSSVYQTNPGASAEPLLNAAGAVPYMTARWVCALSGTQPLAVPSNPAWPVPPSYITSSFLNTNISQAIEFLIYPPICEYQRNGSTGNLASSNSIPTAGTTIGLDTAVVDNYSAYNTTSNVWTAPVAGRYYCYGDLTISAPSDIVCLGAGLTVTSSNYNSGTTITLWGGTTGGIASDVCAAIVRKRLRLNAGDTISLAGIQHSSSSGAALFPGTSGNSYLPRLIIVWEGS